MYKYSLPEFLEYQEYIEIMEFLDNAAHMDRERQTKLDKVRGKNGH